MDPVKLFSLKINPAGTAGAAGGESTDITNLGDRVTEAIGKGNNELAATRAEMKEIASNPNFVSDYRLLAKFQELNQEYVLHSTAANTLGRKAANALETVIKS